MELSEIVMGQIGKVLFNSKEDLQEKFEFKTSNQGRTYLLQPVLTITVSG